MSDTETHERFTVKAFDGEIEVAPIGYRRIRFTCNGHQNAPRVIINTVPLLFDLHIDIAETDDAAAQDRPHTYITRAGTFKDAPLGACRKIVKWAEETAVEWLQKHPERFAEAERVNLRNQIVEAQEVIDDAHETIKQKAEKITDLTDQLEKLK